MLFLSMLLISLLVCFFDNMDPIEIEELGLVKRILGTICRLWPSVTKFIHYVKVLVVLILIYFTFFSNKITTQYISLQNDTTYYVTYSTASTDCKNTDKTNEKIKLYTNQLLVSFLFEFASVIIVLFVMGIIKNLINIQPFLYEPEDHRHGKARKVLMRTLGP
jgi:hypothetical protein